MHSNEADRLESVVFSSFTVTGRSYQLPILSYEFLMREQVLDLTC